MKLLAIEVENLNSLYGRQRVDLQTDLHEAPLFLIVGPTGAGKSTLMDAVSLALFGATSRLTKGSAQSAEDWEAPDDPRHVMSRGCSSASASVEFRKSEGALSVRYRATWQCHRARKKADGSFQKPLRTLERFDPEAATWSTLTSSDKQKDYDPVFRLALEGLTLADFHRCMVLPQGEFAAFLRAAPGDRAQILERLTDTAAYKTYGERAAARKRVAEQDWTLQKAAQERLDAPSEEALAAMRVAEEGAKTALAAVRGEAQALGRWIAWCGSEALLAQESLEAEAEARAVENDALASSQDLARLNTHEQTAHARGLLDAVDTLARELDAASSRAMQLDAAHAECSALVAQAADELAGFEAAQQVAERERDTRAPEIEAARALWAACDEAARDRERTEGERTRLEREAAERGAERDALREREAVAAARCLEASAAWDAVAGDEAIATELPAWREGARALVEQHKALVRLDARLEENTVRRTSRASERAQLEATHTQCSAAVAEATARLAQSRQRLREALGDASDPSQFRLSIDTAMRADLARRGALTALAETRREIDAIRHTLSQIEAERVVAETTLAHALSDESQAALELSAIEAALLVARARLDEIGFARGLAHERHRLRPGEPCALCGSTEHPYAHDERTAAIARELEARAQSIEAEIETLDSNARAAMRARDGARESAAEARSKGVAREAESGRARARLDERVAAAGIERERAGLESGHEDAAIASALKALDARDSELAEKRRVADAAEANVTTSDASLRSANEAALGVNARSNALDAADTEDERQRAEIRSDREVLAGRIAMDTASLGAALAARGFDAADLDAALASAGERVLAMNDARTRRDVTAREAETVTRERLAADALLARVTDDLVRARGDSARAHEQLEALSSRRATLLDGADPAAVHASLQQRLDAAAAIAARARASLATARERLAGATAARDSARSQRADLATELAERTVGLDAQRSTLGLTDNASLRATALDDATRSRIEQMRAQLAARRDAATTRRADRAERLARHRADRPADLPDSPDAEQLTARARALADAVEHDAQQLAELSATRTRGESLRAERERLDILVAESEQRLILWRRLHELIGVKNGDAFRQFAQALNLDELISRANEHLVRLSPRYRLARAPRPPTDTEPSLSFAVRDAWHAGEVRPIGTLSGGETFLVSLALALALANYRSVRLPIETLLLDEGFGTLDTETLETAMDAIESLHARGMQVGIISHVLALRDRIDARIVVEPLGAGHSRIRVEYGPAAG